MIKRILVGLGSLAYAHSATAKAVELANSHHAELTGVTLFDTGRMEHTGALPIGAGHLAREMKKSRLDDVSGVIAAAEVHSAMACEQAAIPYRMRRETGDPLAALVSLTRCRDLIICGLQCLFEHGVVDEPNDELAILVREGVRPLPAVTDENRPVDRALICYNGSMESAKTMRRLIHVRMWPAAKLKSVAFGKAEAAVEKLLVDTADYCRDHGFDPEIEPLSLSSKQHLLPFTEAWAADLTLMDYSAKQTLPAGFSAIRHSMPFVIPRYLFSWLSKCLSSVKSLLSPFMAESE